MIKSSRQRIIKNIFKLMEYLRQYSSVWAMEHKISNRWRDKPSYDEAPVPEDEKSILWKEK